MIRIVKIKPTKSEAGHRFRLWLRRLWSSGNCIVGVASSSRRMNQSQCSIPGLAIGWFFRFCFQPRQCSFHWVISDWVGNRIGRNGYVLILPTPIPSSLWIRLRLHISIFTIVHKRFHDSQYNSVASENQPYIFNSVLSDWNKRWRKILFKRS